MTLIYLLIALINFVFGAQPKPKPPVMSPPAPIVQPVVLDQVKRFTVLISIEGFSGGYRGTGVLIDSQHVLTCAHMIHDGDFWIYTYPLGKVTRAVPVYADKSRDLAILMLEKPIHLQHYATFQATNYIGEPLIVVGNILGSMKWFVSYGMLSDTEDFYYVTTATIRGGNSGGPWANLKGEVIAITDWGLSDSKGRNTGVSGGVNAKAVQEFLKEWKAPSILQFLIGG